MKESTAKPSRGQARSSEVARALIRRTKQASRRRFPGEEKIRILPEGIGAEISVAELCWRDGIHPTVYYTWLKDFMEAGKARMRGGGTHLGRCEVADQPCIWVSVYERAAATRRVEALKVYIPPPYRALRGTSSWINHFLERDSRPGR